VQFVSIVQIDCLPKRPPGQSFAFPEDPYAAIASFQVLVLSTWHSLRDKLFVLVTQVSDVTSVELTLVHTTWYGTIVVWGVRTDERTFLLFAANYLSIA
jgi:hypothetical protein